MKITKLDDPLPAKPPLRIILEMNEKEASALAQLLAQGFDWCDAGSAGIGTLDGWCGLSTVLQGYGGSTFPFDLPYRGTPFKPRK